jgi:hypothetical protein
MPARITIKQLTAIMNFTLSALFSLSIGIGGMAGWVRFKKIDPVFLPFLLLLWAGTLAEGTGLLLMHYGYSNTSVYNLFALAESVLLYYQFKKWTVLRPGAVMPVALLLLLCWLLELLLRPFGDFCSYFIIFYSFVTVFLSISTINQHIYEEHTPLFKNPVFVICFAFIIYFSFSALTETFWVFGLEQSASFRLHMHALLNYINLTCNLLYAIAVLWMPTRQNSLLPSSLRVR